ncbi:MAG: hypothetical protein JXN61_17850 [Sedimentisphaerales bacterium]|nr:hypothetical protein [Sedimentisphaerales bacterium]
MIKALLISFGLVFLVNLVAQMGMDASTHLFKSKQTKSQNEELEKLAPEQQGRN